MKKRVQIYRSALLILGSIISAYGITMAVGAGFGGATLVVLWQGLALTCGISLGLASFLVAMAMIGFSLVYDRKQIRLGTVIYQLLYSGFVDVFYPLQVYPDILWIRLALMTAGIVIFAAGTGAYAAADLGRGSYEALTFSLAEKNHWAVSHVRMSLDFLMVVFGLLLGGTFGLCTVVTVLCSGPIIQWSAAFFMNGWKGKGEIGNGI